MRIKIFLILFFFVSSCYASLPYVPVTFPRDDAAHNGNVPYSTNQLSEWWYYNGKLVTTNGEHFGFFISYNYLQFYWQGQLLRFPMLGFQITDVDHHVVLGNVKLLDDKSCVFDTRNLKVSLGRDISLQKDGNAYHIIGAIQPKQGGPEVNVNLHFTPTRPVFLMNKTGLVDSVDNTNTYYYSFTQMKITGTFATQGKTHVVDTNKSLGWMDHQWGDFGLPLKHQWVWAGIQLDNGIAINIWLAVDGLSRKPMPDASMANISYPDGSFSYTKNLSFENYLPRNGRYPDVYQIHIPEVGINLTVTNQVANQNSGGFWEGIANVDGSYKQQAIHGFAYLENFIPAF